MSVLGIFAFTAVAIAFSRNRKAISWRMVGSGLAFQFVFAVLVLKTDLGRKFFTKFGELVTELLNFSQKGTDFVFGRLSDPTGPWAFVFAVKVLTTIIFFASLMNVLYYLGIMQRVIGVIARGMVFLLGTSGAETLCASANIFMGQTEAPLLIRPFLPTLTQSEMMVMMTSGFATIAAGVMFVYAGMLGANFPLAAGHLLAASVMSAPAAIMMAKILVPETEEPVTRGSVHVTVEKVESNVVEAAANGASQGMSLALNVAAMLIAFIALISMINGALGLVGTSLEQIFGVVFSPFAFLMGVPTADVAKVGNLIGKGLVLNEFVAYTDLNALNQAGQLDGRSVALAIYALCGFANISSVGIQIGGIGAMMEKRKGDLARLGFLALFAATLANFQTAAVAGVLIGAEDTQVVRTAATPAPVVTATPAVTGSPTPTVVPTVVPAETGTPAAEEPSPAPTNS